MDKKPTLHVFIKNTVAFALIVSVFFVYGGLNVYAATASQNLIPYNFRFNTSIGQGSTLIPDIQYLKRFLNHDIRTSLSGIDPCISTDVGNDSLNSYDARVSAAVAKFQQLYAPEILTPAGLTAGNGFLGINSRAKINQLLSTPAYSAIKSTSTTFNLLTGTVATPAIAKYLTLSVLAATASPQSLVTTGNIVGTVQSTIAPILTSAMPNKVTTCGDTITLYGTNFATSSNIVFGTLGFVSVDRSRTYSTMTGQPIDVLSFKLNQLSEYYKYQEQAAGSLQRIVLQVISDNKISDNAAVIEYAFPGQKPVVVTPSTTTQTPTVPANQVTGEQYLESIGLGPKSDLNAPKSQEQKDKEEKNKSGATAAVIAVAAVAAVAIVAKAGGSAVAAASPISNFGGRITVNYPCTCSANTMLTIQDVRGIPKQLIFQPGASILYGNYNIMSGANVLGNYVTGGQCLVYAGTSCVTAGAPIGTITQIGTSLK